jgi:membrane protease YdiL (CAAX protease family)
MSAPRLAAGSLVVAASMAALFLLPPRYFIAAAFVSTSCMILVTLWVGGYRGLFRPSPRSLALGLGSAMLLYLIFLAGSLALPLFHPFGIGTREENSIYSLIAYPSNPTHVQLAVLFLDAMGYESFFRGVLQRRAQRIAGSGAPLVVALADSAVHALTLNPLWVVTTFVVDTVWGYTYQHAKELSSSVTSHFVWDVLIFVLFPIR